MSANPRLCLNMIVKNEAVIISRCLASVAPYISCWSILDTGSNDSTPDIIRSFFAASGIPGELHQGEFVDFATSRNQALQLCRDSELDFEYILLIDADMELQAGDPSWLQHLVADAYKVQQQGAVYYDNLRLLKRTAIAGYRGVTHEYLSIEGDVQKLSSITMLDHACGSNRAGKFERDIRLLRQGLVDEPGNHRYLFYLAQSLRDAGKLGEAISAYRQHMATGAWEEERWYSAYQVANCLLLTGDHEAGVSAALAAWNLRPTRSEPLALLCTHYRNSRQYQLCCEFALIGLRIPYPEQDSLFIEIGLYQWFFRQEIAIAAYYVADQSQRELGRQFCQQLAINPAVPCPVREAARNNLRFYAPQATAWLGMKKLAQFEADRPPGWSNFNPSIWATADETTVVLRLANYQLEDGYYRIAGANNHIRTLNLLIELDAQFQPTIQTALEEVAIGGAVRFDFPVRGYEDGRLIRHAGYWWISSTVRDTTASGTCEIALLKLSAEGRILQEHLLRGSWSGQHQKNWMPFVHEGRIHFVYSLYPLVILRFDENAGSVEEVGRSEPRAALENLRGGGQLVPMEEGGWLGICHEVICTDNLQRHYLHRFFRLGEDWQLAGISDAFSLSGQNIEFCCGLSRQPGGMQLLVSYGVGDREALLSAIDLETLLPQIHPLP